jgi:hypothetical protein
MSGVALLVYSPEVLGYATEPRKIIGPPPETCGFVGAEGLEPPTFAL